MAEVAVAFARLGGRMVLPAFDLLLAVYVAALALILLTGGVDLGVLRLHEPAKPVFALLMLVPLRIAVGGHSWLPTRLQHAKTYVAARLRALSASVPAAVADTLFAIITVRAATISAGFLANIVFDPARPRGFALPFSNEKFVEVFVAWDSGWYWDIAAHGYYFRPDAQSSVAFFPLYPMLMRAVAAPFGGGEAATWIAGIAVALVAYVLALVAIHQFTEQLFGSRETARRTVLYIAVFPWSLFLARVYAESVFLLTTVLAISRAWNGRWWQAGVWGGLATLTRPNGILIALPLALLALRPSTVAQGAPSNVEGRDRPQLGALAARWIRLVPIPLALAGYCGYVYTLSGSPLGWLSAQAHWGYSLGHWPWEQLLRLISGVFEYGPYGVFFTSEIVPFEMLHAAPALLFLVLTPLIVRRLGVAMGMYVLVSLIVPLSSNTLEGLGRYASVLFPVFMLVGSMTTQRAHEGIVIVSLVFRTLLICFFVTWHPIY
ncbi:MAG: hypothetical protein HYU37_22075 [Acidobacteria bacterium]|nr:hypothetical protein [Acidobacteriota bacterium]